MTDDDAPGAGVPGIEDVPALAAWLREQGIPAAGELRGVRLIAGGRSNLTYRLDIGPPGDPSRAPGVSGASGSSSSLVLRRPPLGHVLPTAHDMAREYRVLSALHGTDVPVPRPVVLCEDPGVIGAPFYLMGYVAGLTLRTRQDAALVTAFQAGQLSQRFAEMLAMIHGTDIEAAGLAGFGRPEGYLARQLARWQRQWELSVTREVPGYQRLTGRLSAALGAAEAVAGAGTLVHGDYRLDNMLISVDPGPQIIAVLDWEMSTLGDPLADLGLALVYWADPGEEDLMAYIAGASVTTSRGFLSRAEVAARYADLTGRDLSQIGFYMAFGCFKLAVVLEGIHARFLQRKTVGEGFDREGAAVPALIERAHQLLGTGL